MAFSTSKRSSSSPITLIIVVSILFALAWFGRDYIFNIIESLTSQQDDLVNNSAVGQTEPALESNSKRSGNIIQTSIPKSSKLIKQEAQQYIDELTTPAPDPIKLSEADHFVSRDQLIIQVPETEFLDADKETLLATLSHLSKDTTVTIAREVEELQPFNMQGLIAISEGNLEQIVQVAENDIIVEKSIHQILDEAKMKPNDPVYLLRKNTYYEAATLEEIEKHDVVEATEKFKYAIGTHNAQRANIRDLLVRGVNDGDNLFYIRTVRDTDIQGIWGMIHDGIVKNFARGIAIHNGQQVDTYKVAIPRMADELEVNQQSSFLGKIIDTKTKASVLYNFDRNFITQDPNVIVPDQQIVLIDFSSDELISIYQYFVQNEY